METVIDTLVTNLIFKGDRRELDKFDQGIKNLTGRIDNLAKSFTIAGGIGAAAMGVITKAGLGTEEALLSAKATFDLTEEQMRSLREEALRVGSQLPLNTDDIVKAQLEYGKLGASFKEIMRDTQAIAGAAVATGLHPEKVAEYARIIQNVFGGDLQEIMDIMLRIANRSPATFEAIGASIKFGGQSLADAGLDFATYVALLAGTAGAGRDVESVAQGLVAMWGRLAKSGEGIGRGGKIVTDAFESVGISMDDVNAAMDGTAEGFVQLLELINGANLSTAQLTALLSTLAGDTYASSISYVVQNPEAIRDLIAEIELAPGEVARQQKIIMSGASGALKQMMAQIDTLLNRLAELGALEALEKLARGISSFVGWLIKTNEDGELANKWLLQLITILTGGLSSLLAVGAALKIVSFILSGYAGIIMLAVKWQIAKRLANIAETAALYGMIAAEKVAAISKWLHTAATTALTLSFWRNTVAQGALRIGMLLGAAATGIAAAAQWALNAALIANPIGLVIVALVALAAAIFLPIPFLKTMRDTVLALWVSVRRLFTDMPGWVAIALAVLSPFIGIPLLMVRYWDELRVFVDEVLGWIIATSVAAWERIQLLLHAIGIVRGGTTVAPATSETGARVVEGIAERGEEGESIGIESILPGVTQSIIVLAAALLGLKGLIFSVKTAIQVWKITIVGVNLVLRVWGGLLTVIGKGHAFLTRQLWLTTAATNALSLSFWRNTATAAASRIAMLAGAVATGVWRATMLAGTAAVIVATAVQWAFNLAMAANPIGLIVIGIVALIAGLVLLVKNWDAVKEAVARAWDRIGGFSLALAANPIGLIVISIVALIAGLVLLVKNWDAVKEAVARAWDRIGGFSLALAVNPIGSIVISIVALIAGLVLLVKNWGAVKEAAAWAWDGIVRGFQWAWDRIGGFFGGIADWVKGAFRAFAPLLVLPLLMGRLWDSITEKMLGVWEKIEPITNAVSNVAGTIGSTVGELSSGVGGLASGIGSFARHAADTLHFQQGGIVPGSPAQAVSAILHGGEMVIPEPLVRALQGLSRGLPYAAPMPAVAMGGAGQTTTVYEDSRTFTISEGAIVVNATPDQDPEEIAQVVTESLRDQLQATTRAFDSGILR